MSMSREQRQTLGSLVVRDLSKQFTTAKNGTVTVLDRIDLEVRPGEFLSVVGASGSGKTTLLKTMAGLLSPEKGSIVLDGRDLHQMEEQPVGYVFQQSVLLPWKNVLDNVCFALDLKGEPKKQSRERARELLAKMGLEHAKDYFPKQLSGGMMQRINIARAFLVDAPLLLMDEPFAALDAQTREILQQELLRIWEEYRKTVIFITHQIDEAVYLGDRVLVLSSRPGRVKSLIDIDIPRPRTMDVKHSHRMADLMHEIWKQIEEEVKTNMSLR